MNRCNFIDIDEGNTNNLSLPIYVDPKKHIDQENNTQFPWIYKVRSSVIYTEEFDPERRIRDAYCQSVKQEEGTLLFHPYKKPYTSCIFKKFILEDPYDPQRAVIKYCRENPLKFIIFGKPGVNVDNLGMEIAKYWKCVFINPDIAIKNNESFKLDKNIQNKLRSGSCFGLNKTWIFIKDMINSPDSKRQGYVLSGLPLGYHSNAEFDVIEQMEFIFQTDSRPDIIIYITCPTIEVTMFNRQGFIEDLNTGYFFNISQIKDGEKFSNTSSSAQSNKSEEMDYNYYIIKEYENYFEKEKLGLVIKRKKLPIYSKSSLDTYIKKILPLIDSYILEYDSQCVIKVDGRVPVLKMFDIVKEKLNTLPFIPVYQAKPLFEQKIDEKIEIDTEFLDDRSEDSIEEGKDETYEEEIDQVDDEEDINVEEEIEEGIEENKEEAAEGEEDENEEGNTGNKSSANYFNKMETKAALKRLKERNQIHPNFKWHESDFGVLCPVEFERGNICKGIAGYTCSYLGRLYMMSSLKTMQEFLYDPNHFIIPPKPFPTLKIFVTGPPCSGKTTTVELLSEFFQLEIISIKGLIEEIAKKRFTELEINAFTEKIVKVKKLEILEEEKFNTFEKQRAQDIINWIKDQLLIIYERAKYASLIDLNFSSLKQLQSDTATNLDENELQPEINETEENEDEDLEITREKLVLPKVASLLGAIRKLSKKKELNQIITSKKYTIDFPTRTGMRTLFKNPASDPGTMILKKMSYEEADIEIKSIRKEFQTRGLGLQCFQNTEECRKFLIDPTLLLPYVPNEMCKPYYEIPIVDFNDRRIRKLHFEDGGIRTAFGYVSFSMEELGDVFERKILNIEAEMNMKRKTNDLRIGGWIVDDIPLNKIFWNILIERFLLPDDIIIKKVTNDNYTSIIDNFCNIVNFQKENSNKETLTEENNLNTEELISDQSSDSLIDPQINRFLDVKNSFLKINDHYEMSLEPKGRKKVRKVCSEPSENLETETDGPNENEIINENIKRVTHDFDKYIWPTAEMLEYTKRNNKKYSIENPFDIKTHYIKPFYSNYWDDDLFLIKYFEEITNHRIIPVEIQNDETTDSEKELEKVGINTPKNRHDSLKSQDKNRNDSIISKRSVRKKKKQKDQEESISSSSEEEDVNKNRRKQSNSSLYGNYRNSLSKKKKDVTEKLMLSKTSTHESLFKLHDKNIEFTEKSTNKMYDIFKIFQNDFSSFMVREPKKLELRYLNEIKKLSDEGANMKTIAKAMHKYIKQFYVSDTDISQDNMTIISASTDIGSIDTQIKPKKGTNLLDIFSEDQFRPPLKRTYSVTKLNHNKMKSTSLIRLERNIEEMQMTGISLPTINQPKISKKYRDNLKTLFDPGKNKDAVQDEDMMENQEGEGEGEEEEGEGVEEAEGEEEAEEEGLMEGDKVNNEESIYPIPSEIICLAPVDEVFHKSSSQFLDATNLSNGSEIAIPNRGESKKFSLPRLPRSESKLSRTHSCYCCDSDEPKEYCTCQSSSLSDIQLARQKKRLCIWHETSSVLFPWTPNYERQRKLNELEQERKEKVRLKKSREKFELPIISGSEISTLSKEPASKDILYHEDAHESAISLVYPTSSNDIIKWRKRPEWGDTPQDKSTEEFDIDLESSTRILNKDEFDSKTLLPNLTSFEWERFITFVNGLYLNVSTLKEVGFEPVSSSVGSFYLECCPSGSDSVLSGYQPRELRDPSSSLTQHHDLFTKDEIKAIAKEFVTKLYGQNPDDNYDHDSINSFDEDDEDLCVLEVNLPLTESKFSNALNTALICLTHGKTISELFSADKHEYSGRKRLSSFHLNLMAEDETVKEIELENIRTSIDTVSTEISIYDSLLGIGDRKEFIELFEGNLIRYQSLDERYREPDRIESVDDDHEVDETDEKTCSELYLQTVPKAILYVPLVVEHHCNITPKTRVNFDNLRSYYLLQSRCHLICDDKDEEMVSFRYILKTPRVTKGKNIYNKEKNKLFTESQMDVDMNDEEQSNENNESEGEEADEQDGDELITEQADATENETEIKNNESVPEDKQMAKGELKNEEGDKEQMAKGELKNEESDKEQMVKGELKNEEGDKEQVAKGELKNEESDKEQMAKGELKNEEGDKEQVAKGELKNEEGDKEQMAKGELKNEESDKEQMVKGELKNEGDKEQMAKAELKNEESDKDQMVKGELKNEEGDKEQVAKGELKSDESDKQQMAKGELKNEESDKDYTLDNGKKSITMTDSSKEKQIASEESDIPKSIQISFPYDIIKLIFEKYEIIALELPDNDDDEELNTALSSMILPKSFDRFLRALNYNIITWLNEWEIFHNEMLKDIRCNLVINDFLPFYCDLQAHKNNCIFQFLHNYEPSVEIKKEELIKTTDLETNDLETESLKVSDEDLHVKDLERDIGDTDICEILPDEFSDVYPYCPVIFRDRNELVPVSNTLKVGFRDEWYNFSSEEAMHKFINRPEKYTRSKNAEYISEPLRICVVAPGDFNGVCLGRNIADFFGIPFMTLLTEIKRIKSVGVDLPVGIFDEDQRNIKLFGLEEEKSKKDDFLENENWDHFRNYYNHSSPLTDQELDALIQPLWKRDLGFMFYSFPYSFNDLEYMTKKEMVPDVIVFIDTEKQRKKERKMLEQRIKTRQLLNFGARLKKLLAADHLRFNCWKDVYPKLFNIVLRKFLKERRRDHNFNERLKLVKPTVQSPEGSVISEPLGEEPGELHTWDVEWMLYQVNKEDHEKAIPHGLLVKKTTKHTNILDDPMINPELKTQLLETVQSKFETPEVIIDDNIIDDAVSTITETSNRSKKDKKNVYTSKRLSSSFPDLKILQEQTIEEVEEESTESSDSSNDNKALQDFRQVAVTNLLEPSFPKLYQHKFKPTIFKNKKNFDESDYSRNVTNASSTSSLGLDEIDSIQSRELTSSLSLIDIKEFEREERLLHLILGKIPPLKMHLNDIVKKYKELYPTPKCNARNLKKVSLSHSKDKLEEYYQKENESRVKMQDLCNQQNIAYLMHQSTSSFNDLLKNIKNLIRKPNALDKVYIINYKLGMELIENGLYFLSRFGYWCPVQIYDKDNPLLSHYPKNIKENAVIPVIHKRYIYFINGRNSVIKFSETPLKYIKQDTILSIFPAKVAIIGSHKSRKSSTASNLAKLHGLELITLEKVLNYVTEKLFWTDLSMSITKTLKKGGILEPTYIVQCIEAFINGSSKSLTYGWVLDGFPINNDDLELMKEGDIIPQVIFSIESDDEFTKDMFENLNSDRNEIQEIIYRHEEYVNMINDEEEDDYYNKNQSNSVEEQDFDQKLIEFEINNLLPPVLIMENRMVDWLHAVSIYDDLLNKANSKWGNVHKVEWKKEKPELLYSVNEVLMVYLWALQDYNSNLTKGLPASIYLVGITEDEYELHKSPFKDCCPGCWYYNRIYFRCPTCKFKDMKPGLVQYENFFYWLCLKHYDIFLSDPVKLLMSYRSVFAKQYPEKAKVGDKYIKDNLQVMCNGLCITCYSKNLPDIVYNNGYSQHSVIIEKKKIYLFCSDNCVCEMLMNPTRFLNLEIESKEVTGLPHLKRLVSHLPPKGLCEQLVTDAIYEGVRQFLFLRPKIYQLSHKTSACTYLALNLKIKAKNLSDNERNYYKSLLRYLENHCKENEMFCKNINQIMAFMSPLSMIEYTRTQTTPIGVQNQLLQNSLPFYKGQHKRNKNHLRF